MGRAVGRRLATRFARAILELGGNMRRANTINFETQLPLAQGVRFDVEG